MRRVLLLMMMLSISAAWAQINDDFGSEPTDVVNEDPTPSNAGSGGVELSEIPIALSSRCDSVVLKGTKRFANTAFLMPKGNIAKDEFGQYLIEVVPVNKGESYNLRMTMSFTEVIRDPLAENALASKIIGCDYEQLKAKVNNYLDKVGDKVSTLATLPVSNIGFTFKINGKTYKDRLGTVDTNSLNYLKEANILEFSLSRSEVDEFLELVNGRLGLNVNLDVNFTAKRELGRVDVSVDNKALANDLEAKLSGQKKIVAADLRAAVSTSLNATTANIRVEGGAVRTQLMEVASRIVMGILQASGFGYDGFGGGVDDWLDYEGDDGMGGGGDSIDRWRRRRGSIFGGNEGGDDFGGGDGSPVSGNMVDVKAFLALLRDKKNLTFNYVVLGGPQVFSYRTSSNLKLNTDDLLLKKSTFSTSEPRRLPWFLKKGESFTFSINRKIKRAISYQERKNYFNKSDILNNDKLKDIFETLLNADESKIQDKTELNDEKAEYKFEKWIWTTNANNPVKVPYKITAKYYWGAYTYDVKKKKTYDKYMELESLNHVLSLPLEFKFSRGGRRYNMKKLFTPNPYWEVKYNDFTGTITFKAKRTLGVMTVINKGSAVIPSVKLNAGVFEQFKGTKGSTIDKRPQFEDSFPTREEVYEIQTSRFWGDEDLEEEMDDFPGLF